MKTNGLKILVFLVGAVLFACDNHQDEHHSDSHHGLAHNLPTEVQDTVVYNEEMATLMEDLKKALVNIPQNEQLKDTRSDSTKKTFVLTRKQHLTSFPCSNCHGEITSELKDNDKDAHWEVQLNHANAEVMDCNTCHDLEKSDVLSSLNGSSIDFDHSYQQCAQCHSSQAKDWLGGAHGKRVRGWVKPRTIYNCVSCHNPHQPKIKSRWPARLNTAKLKEREE